MTQNRYIDYGVPADAIRIRELISGLTSKGVLSGGSLNVIAPDIVTIDPFWMVFEDGLVINSDEIMTIQIPTTSSAKNYTLTLRHQDSQLIGGAEAVLDLEDGFLLNEDILDGIALGFVQYPGGAVAVLVNHLIQAPQADLSPTTTEGDGDFKFPPFSDGALRTVNSGIVPTVSDTAVAATLVYTNGAGGVTLTANSTGPSGNFVSLKMVALTGLSQATSALLTATTNGYDILVSLGTNGSGVTNAQMITIAAVINALINVPVAASPTGNIATVAAPLAKTFLSGGLATYGFAYQFLNGTSSPKTDTLKFVFVAHKQPPRQILIEFAQGADTDPADNLSLIVLDTNGDTVAVAASTMDTLESSGLLRRRYRLLDGIFTPGYRYHISFTLVTPPSVQSSIALVGSLTHGLLN